MDLFLGRTRELGLLRSALDRTDPSILRVRGVPGAGKTALVRRACETLDALHFHLPPLPEPLQLAAAARALDAEGHARPRAGADGSGSPGEASGSWEDFLRAALHVAPPGERPRVLVLDDAHRLVDARARITGPLDAVLARARSDGRTVHVVLVGPGPGLPVAASHPSVALDLDVGPLGLRAALPRLPGTDPVDRIRSYATLGGLPGRLALVDPDATLATNIRRLVLDRDAPLRSAGLDLLERAFQTPSRYAAILATLGRGEADWASIHAGVPDLTTSGQVAPYLKRLEELGVVDVRRSLDAAPGGRSRRYRIRDPFDAFWFRFALPMSDLLERGEGDGAWTAHIRPVLDEHVGTVFPEICRGYMDLDAMESLPSNAREVGGLWGSTYEIDVAGVLRTGAAFYGAARWNGAPDPDVLTALDAEVGETRYGFGREARIRIVFARGPFTPILERVAARRPDAVLVDARALVGDVAPR